MRPAAIVELDKLAKALEDESLRHYKFVVEGHTCDRGSADHNMDLSMRRADAVADFITSSTNLSPAQFDIKWYGESKPAESNYDESSREQNRRVVIKNTLEKAAALSEGRPAVLQIISFQNGQEEIVADGDTLQSGAHYSITFKSAAEPYAYVCQMESHDQAVLLFPDSAHLKQGNPVTPGLTYHIPGSDEVFFLDNATGIEQFVLVTHQTPLSDPILACKAAFNSDSVKQRGVGGIASVPPVPPVTPAENHMQLCEVMPGGKTRGVGGIERIGTASNSAGDNVTAPNNSCQGFFLKRYFLHK